MCVCMEGENKKCVCVWGVRIRNVCVCRGGEQEMCVCVWRGENKKCVCVWGVGGLGVTRVCMWGGEWE